MDGANQRFKSIARTPALAPETESGRPLLRAAVIVDFALIFLKGNPRVSFCVACAFCLSNLVKNQMRDKKTAGDKTRLFHFVLPHGS